MKIGFSEISMNSSSRSKRTRIPLRFTSSRALQSPAESLIPTASRLQVQRSRPPKPAAATRSRATRDTVIRRRAADAENHDNRYYVPTTKTDDKGNFELKFVGPGKHYIQVDPFFLNPTEAPANPSTVIDVKEGETIDDVKIGPQD